MADWSQYEEKSSASKTDWSKYAASDESKAEPGPLGAVGTFARQVGKGASLGLAQYPAAAVMMGVRRLTGYGGPENTFTAALQTVREQEQQQQQQYPLTSLAGNIVGSAVPTMMTGGGGLLAQTGKSALQSGIAAGAESENLSDVPANIATGAAVGGTITGLLGAPAKFIARTPSQEARVVKDAYITRQAQLADKHAARGEELLVNIEPTLTRIGVKTPQEAIDLMRRAVQTKTEPELKALGVTSGEREVMKGILDAQRRRDTALNKITNVYGINPKTDAADIMAATKGSVGFGPRNTLKDLFQTTKEYAPDIAGGAIAGGLTGYALGQDPYSTAGLGAGLAGLYDLKTRGVPTLAKTVPAALMAKYPGITRAPQAVMETGTRITGQQLAPLIAQPTGQIEPSGPVENKSRLQELADRFRERFSE